MAGAEPSSVRALCGNCSGVRNCDVKGSHTRTDESDGMWFSSRWEILECRGCSYVFVRLVEANSENSTPQYVEELGEHALVPDESISFWPAIRTRMPPDWLPELSSGSNAATEELEGAMKELYGALNADLSMLSAIGVRTCFDVAATALKIDANLPFAGKLKALVAQNSISATDQGRLATLIDGGSASAHRGWIPSPTDLTTMVALLEDFVFDSIVKPMRKARLDTDAKKLSTKVPKRKTI